MHYAVNQFIKEIKKEIPYKFRLRKILEVGSHNINGSPRKYFWFCKYTGVDITKGRGVDVVGKLSEVEIEDDYSVVISTEMLEHDSDWKQSLKIMYEKLKDTGLMIITCAAPMRKEHGTRKTDSWCSPDTNDYYRNISLEDFRSVLPPHLFDTYILQYARGENDLQFYGIKKEPLYPTSQEIYSTLLKRKKVLQTRENE